MTRSEKADFLKHADRFNVIPVCRRIMSDQLTPVLAYRRLVAADDAANVDTIETEVLTAIRQYLAVRGPSWK